MILETASVFYWFECQKNLKNYFNYMAAYAQGIPKILLFVTVIVLQDYMIKLYRVMKQNYDEQKQKRYTHVMVVIVLIVYLCTLTAEGYMITKDQNKSHQAKTPTRVATMVFCLWFSVPNLFLLFEIRKCFCTTFQISFITCRFTNFCLVVQSSLTLYFGANLLLVFNKYNYVLTECAAILLMTADGLCFAYVISQLAQYLLFH